MPRIHVLGLLLLFSPMLFAGCETPTVAVPDAALRFAPKDTLLADPPARCSPPRCRISFSLTNASVGQSSTAGDLGWQDVKPNDTTPWVLPQYPGF